VQLNLELLWVLLGKNSTLIGPDPKLLDPVVQPNLKLFWVILGAVLGPAVQSHPKLLGLAVQPNPELF
jgi:hypothetical protein